MNQDSFDLATAANEVAREIVTRLAEPTVHKYYVLQRYGLMDVVNVPIPPEVAAAVIAKAGQVQTHIPEKRMQVRLVSIARESFDVPDEIRANEEFVQLASPHIEKIVTKIRLNIANAKHPEVEGICLATAQLPLPMAGTGAKAVYGDALGFGLRAMVYFNTGTLVPRSTIDVLYGVGPYRKTDRE